MPLSQEAIEANAHLARLGVENTRDNHSIQDDLNKIIEMVNQICAVNTKGIDPMAHPYELPQRLRPDIVTESEPVDFLSLAPTTERGLYLVPKVIE